LERGRGGELFNAWPRKDGSPALMWVKFMDVADGYAAGIWQELFFMQALPVRVVPPLEMGTMRDVREILVPDGKTHVAREVLNKI
jgi:hypothetical protein